MNRYKLTTGCVIVLILIIVGITYACVNYPPIPYITNVYTQYAVKGQDVYFNGSSSEDMDELGEPPEIRCYHWQWESGGTYYNAGATPSHSYPSAGYNYVTLKVYDNDNYTPCEVAAHCEVYVSEVATPFWWYNDGWY